MQSQRQRLSTIIIRCIAVPLGILFLVAGWSMFQWPWQGSAWGLLSYIGLFLLGPIFLYWGITGRDLSTFRRADDEHLTGVERIEAEEDEKG